MGQPPVLTSPNPISTLQKQFACARLSRPCLPGSSSRLFCNVHHHRLYGVFIVKRFESGDLSFSLYRSVSLFDLESRFFAPTRSIARPARAGAVKVGRRSNLASYCALARPHLDSFEHDGTVGAVGMTIRGEPAFRARINRATTLYPVGPGPEP